MSTRRIALAFLWRVSGWFASHRRAGASSAQVEALDFPTQVRGRGMRWTERLRDRLRPRWLRIRRDDASAT